VIALAGGDAGDKPAAAIDRVDCRLDAVRSHFARGSACLIRGRSGTDRRGRLRTVTRGSRPLDRRSRYRSLTGSGSDDEHSESGQKARQEGALQHELTWIRGNL
jgi:hypothetical protein